MHNHDEHHHNHAASGSPEEMATCPVMRLTVNKKEAKERGLVRTYNGREYYLCCAACERQFDRDPAAYQS